MTAPEPDSLIWHKSSYSTGNGDCVQVGWRTSSYSTNEGDCVEVATVPDRVLVRDSKDPDGPALAVPTPLASLPHPLALNSDKHPYGCSGVEKTAISIHVAV